MEDSEDEAEGESLSLGQDEHPVTHHGDIGDIVAAAPSSPPGPPPASTNRFRG